MSANFVNHIYVQMHWHWNKQPTITTTTTNNILKWKKCSKQMYLIRFRHNENKEKKKNKTKTRKNINSCSSGASKSYFLNEMHIHGKHTTFLRGPQSERGNATRNGTYSNELHEISNICVSNFKYLYSKIMWKKI